MTDSYKMHQDQKPKEVISFDFPSSKPITKYELADRLGISQRTLQRWINRLTAEETLQGYDKKSKFIMPAVAQVIAEKLCL